MGTKDATSFELSRANANDESIVVSTWFACPCPKVSSILLLLLHSSVMMMASRVRDKMVCCVQKHFLRADCSSCLLHKSLFDSVRFLAYLSHLCNQTITYSSFMHASDFPCSRLLWYATLLHWLFSQFFSWILWNPCYLCNHRHSNRNNKKEEEKKKREKSKNESANATQYVCRNHLFDALFQFCYLHWRESAHVCLYAVSISICSATLEKVCAA